VLNSDLEVVIDYENFQNEVQSKASEYYEEMVFSTGKKSMLEESLEVSDTYEDVAFKTSDSYSPRYENVIFDGGNNEKLDESLYTVGRRFPSIRSIKPKERKEAKKDLYAKPDKSVKISTESGSSARPVTAIYGTLTHNFQSKIDMSLPDESNIYENERIILKQLNQKKWCKNQKPAMCYFL